MLGVTALNRQARVSCHIGDRLPEVGDVADQCLVLCSVCCTCVTLFWSRMEQVMLVYSLGLV